MAKQTDHIVGFDYLRIAAVFAVVWIHGSDTNPLAKNLQNVTVFAIPCFVLMSGYLIQRSAILQGKQLNYSRLLFSRFRRWLPAYFVWSTLYILARWCKHQFITDIPLEFHWGLVVLGGGASYQLWYIPALVIWILIFGYFAIKVAQSKTQICSGILLILVGILLLYVGKQVNDALIIADDYALIVRSTIGGLGYFPLAMGVALLLEGKWADRISKPIRLISIFLGAAVVASYFSEVQNMTSLHISVFSVSLFLLVLLIKRRLSSNIFHSLSIYTFGIYFCHAFFVEGFQMVLAHIGIDLTLFLGAFSVILLSFLFSVLLCLLLGRYKVTRWLVV